LIRAFAAVAAGGDDLQIGRGMFLARFQEEDVAGGRDLPGDGVTDRDISDLVLLGKDNLGRGSDDAVDLDDIDSLPSG